MKDKKLLLAVLAQLEREKTVSIPQLAQLLGINEERVYEALEILVFAYDAASVRLDLHDAYATLETYGTERLLRLTPQEADALVDALMNAGFSQDDALVQALLQTKSIVEPTSDPSEPRVRIVSESSTPLIVQELSAACENPEHPVLEIAYWGADDDWAELRHIEPAMIFSEKSHQYLLAFCREAQDWRSFRVDRISDVQTLEERFEPHGDMPDPKIAFLRNASEARIRFEGDCEIPSWRGMRIVDREEGGSCVMRIPWTGSAWLPKQLVALMGKAHVLEPAALADACDSYAKSLLRTADMQECSSDLLDGNTGAE